MLATFGATAPPSKLLKSTLAIEALTDFCSAHKRYELYPFMARSPPRLRGLAKITRRVSVIRIVAIAASATPSLKASFRPQKLIWPRPRLRTIVIVAAIDQSKRIVTWARPPIIIVTRRTISLINISSHISQKTIISLGNLFVGDWC